MNTPDEPDEQDMANVRRSYIHTGHEVGGEVTEKALSGMNK
jgi:hypothetical protein